MDPLLDYCRRDVELTLALHEGAERLEAYRRELQRKIRRAASHFEEDGILPLALHDDSRVWGLK